MRVPAIVVPYQLPPPRLPVRKARLAPSAIRAWMRSGAGSGSKGADVGFGVESEPLASLIHPLPHQTLELFVRRPVGHFTAMAHCDPPHITHRRLMAKSRPHVRGVTKRVVVPV